MRYGKQDVSIGSLVRRNWLRTEMRVKINEAKVEQYAREMREGAVFPCPIAFVDPKTELFLVGDGFHRILACKENKAKAVEVELKRGRYLDAVVHNIEANRSQRGLPFSQGDLQKCIATLLTDPESSKWTQTKIADTVGCSIAYTSQVVKKLAIERPSEVIDKNGRVLPNQHVRKIGDDVAERRNMVMRMFLKGMSKSQIQEELGIGRSTVARDIEIGAAEQHMIECPRCHGSGIISNLEK